MIQFLADAIDQLDLALDQLVIKDRNFDRFALMLIDNVVELSLHQFAQDRAGENELYAGKGEFEHDPKLIQKALGQRFPPKAILAKEMGLISADQCKSVLNLHTYRNTAYHRGQRHEGILHSLAIFYFRIACEILKAYRPRWWASVSNDAISHRARKYLGNADFFKIQELCDAAFQRLIDVSEGLEIDLIGDLYRDIEQTIQSTDGALQFLADDAPQARSRESALIDAQAWPFLFSEEAKAYAERRGIHVELEKQVRDVATMRQVAEYIDWMMKHYNWPVTVDPIPSWARWLESFGRQTDYHIALGQYCDFLKQTERLRGQISEAALQLDMHIQRRIDEIRGK